MKVLRAAADQGDTKAQVALGTLHVCGHGCPKDLVAGLRWLRRAAESGSRYAQIKLVEASAVGGIKAERWLRAGVAEGNAHAMTVLGLLFSRGDLPGGWTEAVKMWQRAADLGSSVAQHYLGCAHLEGAGVPASQQQAIHYLRLAEAQGRRDAKHMLTGLGAADEQAPTATECLHTAAFLGDPQAQFDLACAYAEGEDGLDGPNAVRLAWWLRLSSPGRQACGQREVLGRNLGEAIAWWRQAATAGVPEAQCNLAVAYLRGIGVRADLQHAVTLLRAAASGGHTVASLYLVRVGADADSAGGLGRGASSMLGSFELAGLGDQEEDVEEERCKGGGDAAAGDEIKSGSPTQHGGVGSKAVNKTDVDNGAALTTNALAARLRHEAAQPSAEAAAVRPSRLGLQEMTAFAATLLAASIATGPRNLKELLATAQEQAQELLASGGQLRDFRVQTLRQLRGVLSLSCLCALERAMGSLEELHCSMGQVLYAACAGEDHSQESARWPHYHQRYLKRRPLASHGPEGSCGVPGRLACVVVQDVALCHDSEEVSVAGDAATCAARYAGTRRRGQVSARAVAHPGGSWLCTSTLRVRAPSRVERRSRQEAAASAGEVAAFAGEAGGADSAAGEAPRKAM